MPLIEGRTVRLPPIVGLGRALDLILTGRPVGAVEAVGVGLADRVVRTGTSRVAAEALVREFAFRSRRCASTASRSMRPRSTGVSNVVERFFGEES